MKDTKPPTMEEVYGDTSYHLCCPNCGMCIDCNDCNCKMRKEWIRRGLILNLDKGKGK